MSREIGISPGTRLEEDREQSVLHRLFWKRLPSRRAARNLKAWISISPEVACNSREGLEAGVSRESGGRVLASEEAVRREALATLASDLFLFSLVKQLPEPHPRAQNPLKECWTAKGVETPWVSPSCLLIVTTQAPKIPVARAWKHGKVCRLLRRDVVVSHAALPFPEPHTSACSHPNKPP